MKKKLKHRTREPTMFFFITAKKLISTKSPHVRNTTASARKGLTVSAFPREQRVRTLLFRNDFTLSLSLL